VCRADWVWAAAVRIVRSAARLVSEAGGEFGLLGAVVEPSEVLEVDASALCGIYEHPHIENRTAASILLIFKGPTAT
jgi:hypothetical protein